MMQVPTPDKNEGRSCRDDKAEGLLDSPEVSSRHQNIGLNVREFEL